MTYLSPSGMVKVKDRQTLVYYAISHLSAVCNTVRTAVLFTPPILTWHFLSTSNAKPLVQC